MKKRETYFCRIKYFSDEEIYFNTSEWLDFCRNYGSTTIELDSSGEKVLYQKVKNKNNKKIVTSRTLEVIKYPMTFYFIFFFIFDLLSGALLSVYWLLFGFFSGLCAFIISIFNNPKNFNTVNGVIVPEIKMRNGYYLNPICYVTFFENLEKSDSLKIKNDFYKFRKQFYDYLNR